MRLPEFLADLGSSRYRRFQAMIERAPSVSRQMKHAHRTARAVITFACSVPLFPLDAAAQALNLAIDSTVGSGVRRAPGPDGDAISKRTPAFFDVDVGLVLDNDWSSEWGAGFKFQLEDQLAVGVAPQVRLIRGERPWNFLIGLGVPIYVTPGTLIGVEVDAGGIFRFTESLGAVALVSAEYFFAGGDLPEDGGVLMFNFAVGVRVLL
jgi:hypothetical protein